MPSLTALVLSLSLDVTDQLVAAGITAPIPGLIAGSPPLTIVGATATTPIVLTLSAPAPWSGSSVANPQRITAVIAGVLGMTEANGTWILTPTAPGANTVTLTTYWQESSETYVNELQNSVGVHAYTGGGTIATALTDGRIALGFQHESENSSPPRIIMTPVSAMFAGADTNDRKQGGFRGNTVAGHGQSQEQILEQAARMVAGERDHFNVTVWGAANPPDPDFDFDALQVLYQQFIRSLYYLMEGCYSLGTGRFDKTNTDQLGHKMVFPLDVDTPILDYILGTTTLQTIDASVALETPDEDAPETAWSGTIPS